MPREGRLSTTKDKQSGKWFVNVSAKLSKTGKRSRRKFATKKEAKTFRSSLDASLRSPRLKNFDEERMISANYYNEAFLLYGFKGLDEACAAWS